MTPPTRVSHPALAALLARWQACAAGRPMPMRDDLGFLNLKPWRGHLMLLEVIDHGRQFRIVASPGVPADNGDDVAPAVTEAIGARVALDEIYGRVMAQRAPATAIIPSRVRRGGPSTEVLVLPLAGADGLVAMLLVAAYDELTQNPDQSRDREG